MVLVDGGLKRRMDLAQAVVEDVGEADQNGQVDAAKHQRIDQLFQVDGPRRVFFRVNQHVPVAAHREIAFAPTGNVVEITGELRRPPFCGLNHHGTFAAVSFQLASFSLYLSVSFESKGRGKRKLVTFG